MLACIAIGFAVGAAYFMESAPPVRNTVAISWGDHTSGDIKSYYGAHVYVVDANGGLDVKFAVYIGRPNAWTSYQHAEVLLGHVTNWEEAAMKFGSIRWTTTDIRVGNGTESDYKLSRSELQSHR